jgi:hypothetical protein
MNRNQPSQGLESFLLYLPYPYEMPFLYGGKFLFPSQIFLCLGTILPDSANFGAGVLVRTVTTSLVALGGHTVMNLAKMTAKVEFEPFRTAPCTINALWRDLISMIHLAPFLGNLNAHFVVVLYCGDASLTGLAVDATACNHFIHVSYLIIILHLAKHYTFPT